MGSRAVSSAGGCAAAAGLTLVLGACGSVISSAGTSTSATTSASARASATAGSGGTTGVAIASCAAGSLQVTLDTRAAGAAAGSSFFPIDFTNTSPSRCNLAGYPAVSFAATAAGSPIGAPAAPDHSVLVHAVTLAPGGTAHAWLQVIDAMNYPASQCHPVTARGLMVDLPGQARTSYLEHPFPACAAVLQGSQILTIQPIQPGRARRGTAQ